MGVYIDAFDGIPFNRQPDFSRMAGELAACDYRGNITLSSAITSTTAGR